MQIVSKFTVHPNGFVEKSTTNVIGEVDYDEDAGIYVCFIKPEYFTNSMKHRVCKYFKLRPEMMVMEEIKP